ncbi:BamA/TamA family outer membrane protein [Aquipluma nitroreducens]|nr:hypothetical protein [Aquipluma nitroreducens]
MKIALFTIILLSSLTLAGKDVLIQNCDTLKAVTFDKSNKLFYDSLQIRASRHRVTRWLYGTMIRSARDSGNVDFQSYEYYKSFQKKTIGTISIRSLKIFGPNFDDTLKTTNIWIEKAANTLHSQSNLYVIRKNLWIREGQSLDPDLMMDNERLLRSLPYLKDVRIVITPRPLNNDLVDILILTQDVFSFGVTGGIGSVNKGEVGIYDKNILGVGHEAGVTIVAHTDKAPHIGFESYYSVNNIMGNFINFSTGYANTYLHQELFLSLQRDFLRPQSVYAGGFTTMRSFRTDRVYLNNNVISTDPLNYIYLDGWYGRRLKLGIRPNDSRFQMTLSGRIRYTHFYDRPLPDSNNNQYFANSKFYLGSLSFSHRSYVRDYLVYSYGITEDIPKGYLCELVFGYDHNEFNDRWYSHVFLSTGNLFKNKPFYLYTSLGVGSFFNQSHTEQGMADLKFDFISPLFQVLNVQARQFIKLNYTIGINRFDIENLLLLNSNGIRGFGSLIGKGKQRLTLNVENVFFQKKAVLNFKTALFSFFDVGIVGPSEQSIFKQSYYAGLGLGLRIRNENLVFKTIQLRLAWYPNHPSDVNSIGFILDGVSKTRFYNFQPRGPEPLRFE